MTTPLFSLQHVTSFAENVFKQVGFAHADAVTTAQLLVKADIRGVDSHGIARLSGYVRLVEAGRLEPKPDFRWHQTLPTLARLNAGKAIGFLSAKAAMDKAIEMAGETGVGMVGVSNSNHFGIAGQYALMATQRNMIGVAMTNASPLVAPTHSIDKLLGTNPISVAVPALRNKPFVLDMATTTAANGKLEILQRKNMPAPEGWIQTQHGAETTNASELKIGGALRPLGSFPWLGSHKGYGLGSVVDIFSGVLSGANFGPWVPPFVSFLPLAGQAVGEGIGHFFMAFRVDGFGDETSFLEKMDVWMDTFRASKTIDEQPVMVAGDPEWKMEAERTQHGIPLLNQVVDDLNQLAQKLGLAAFHTP